MKKIWIEYLRVLAIIAVVTIHSTAGTYNDFGHIQLYNWWIANILDSFSRFAVPMFVMISGCVLLGRDFGVQDFYIKRGVRLLPALLFWSLFYIAFDFACNDRELSSILKKLTIGLFVSGKAYYHLWYLSMYICLMLFAPFINNYITGKKPTLEDFVYIFFVFSLFLSLNQISSIGREVFHTNISWFKLFPWFIGYFIMGYFIDTYYDKIPIGNKINIFILVCILSLSCMLNFYSASSLGIVKDSFILSKTGILTFIVTISIFYLFSKNRNKLPKSYLISNVASRSFGIYLIHPFFLDLFKEKITNYVNEPIIGLPLLIVLILVFSFLTISILTKIKWFKAVC